MKKCPKMFGDKIKLIHFYFLLTKKNSSNYFGLFFWHKIVFHKILVYHNNKKVCLKFVVTKVPQQMFCLNNYLVTKQWFQIFFLPK